MVRDGIVRFVNLSDILLEDLMLCFYLSPGTVSGIEEKMPQHDFISRHMTGDPRGACTW